MLLKNISSSQLQKVIDIITYENGIDNDGIPVDNERVVATVRARVDTPSLARQEKLIGLGVNISKSLMFLFRYIDNLDSEVHKIRYKGKIYEIQGVENVQEKDLYLNVLGENKV